MLKKLAGRNLLKEDLRAFGSAIESVPLREGLALCVFLLNAMTISLLRLRILS